MTQGLSGRFTHCAELLRPLNAELGAPAFGDKSPEEVIKVNEKRRPLPCTHILTPSHTPSLSHGPPHSKWCDPCMTTTMTMSTTMRR